MATILDLETETIRKLENQSSQAADVDRWLRDTLVEIAGNPDYRDSFAELEEFGPTFNLTGGTITTSVQEYDESNLIPVGDFLIKTLDIMVWTDYPANTKRKQLQRSHYQDADKYQSYPSLPTAWYRFGRTIGFEPTPDKAYQVQARIMRRHPITDYFNTTGQLNTTPILLPNEWFEILEWGAAMRGFMELLNYQRAGEIRTMLYGDPEDPAKPGLISSVKTVRESEAWLSQQPLRPIVKSSCWGA